VSDYKQHINLKLDIHNVALDIDPEKEQTYREATAWLNKRYQFYQARFQNASPEKLWMYVALESAVGLHADVRDKSLEPVRQKLSELNKRINEALKPSI
jgi:hypothetical protein